MVEHQTLLIGGQQRAPSSSEVIEVTGASTGTVVGRVPSASPADVDAAAAAARSAFDDPSGWASWPREVRAAALFRFADVLESRAEQLAQSVSLQNGMPISIARTSEGVVGPRLLRYYAAVASAQSPDDTRERLGGGQTLLQKRPLGVAAVVVPWNFPVSLAFFKLAPALAAGCTVVWKPSPETVLDAWVILDAAQEAGLADGVLNLVPGGRDTGAYLVAHPQIDKVAFTGSTVAGRAIGEVCGKLLRPATLELGGKSAAIVLEDADLPAHAAEVFAACLLNSGQTCYLSTRILAPRHRYAETVDFFAQLAASLRIGDPFDPSTQLGPVATEAQRERVEGFIAQAKTESRLVAGGGRPADQPHGWYLEPTVFADVDPSSRLAREEVFGPVLAITAYDDEDDAVRLANDSSYGLGGTVWTGDIDRGVRLASRIETGAVGINGFRLDAGSPFGGVKSSGLGQELGPEGLAAYQTTRAVYRTLN